MKKLLALALVLSIASLATAGTSLVNLGGGVLAVDSDVLNGYTVYLLGGPVATDVSLTPAGNGNLSYVAAYGVLTTLDNLGVEYGVRDIYEINVASSAVPTDLVAGNHALATFAGLEFGDVDLGLGSVILVDADPSVVLGEFFVTPEPATMALLGLGALVLRRKK